MKSISLGCSKYFATFLDKATDHLTAILIKTKNEASVYVLLYVFWVERKTENSIEMVKMDGASKSDYSHAVKILEKNCIVVDPSAPYTSAENGCVERINHTLNNSVRWMLSHSTKPKAFWTECLMNAVGTRNFIP